MHSPTNSLRFSVWQNLIGKELRELIASRSFWLMLLVVSALVGQAFITSVNLYAEASGAGGNPAALSQGLSPLEGIAVPTFGAYDLASLLLFPFVVIRLFAIEKESGALLLMLQAPVSFLANVVAKGIALFIAWVVALLPGLTALAMWKLMNGHLYTPEIVTLLLGYLLRGIVTIGIGAVAAALSASASSAAIIALTFTLATWVLDYIAAARGGIISVVANYTPWAALRVFERGELSASVIAVLLTSSVGALLFVSQWLRVGVALASRLRFGALCALATVIVGSAAATLSASKDTSENRRNSFPAADEAALADIAQPLVITVYLAAEDPRLVDLDRGVLAKLRRTMKHVSIVYAAKGRTGLFEQAGDHYGEVWYALGDKRVMSRSATEEIVLETIFDLAGKKLPALIESVPYPGYPLDAKPVAAPWVFFGAWPLLICSLWFVLRRHNTSRLQQGD
ncbi:MAG: hypothetical protein ABJC26_00165 [Gemmatimonadaceae bacterium]